MSGADRVPAVGGERTVLLPDPIARDYLLLALRLDQLDPGLVDGYVGPAGLKATVDLDPLRSAARLREDARELLDRLPAEVDEPRRRAWLEAQLVALETRAAVLAGWEVPFLEQVERGYQWWPRRRDEDAFDEAADELSALLTGTEPLDVRLEAWDRRLVIEPARLHATVDWLVAELRTRAADRFGLPDGESLRVGLVRDQPWSGYCWFDGGGRSRIDLNLDLPVRAPDLVATLAHETYAGHHLENAWKEAALVEGGWLEASVMLLQTPECLVSEGLAEVGPTLLLPTVERVELLDALFDRAGLELGGSEGRREAAEICVAIAPLRRRLGESVVNAALLRHVEGGTTEAALAYLRRFGRYPEARARQRLGFLEDARWRTYVFVYDEGFDLVRRWVELAPPDRRDGRFSRLMREQVTPVGLAADLGMAGPEPDPLPAASAPPAG